MFRRKRTIVDVDGFNLYYGLRQSGWRHLYWLDIRALAEGLIPRHHQTLVGVKYFTSRVRGPQAKVHRQSAYLDVLAARGGLDIFYGHYTQKRVSCAACGHTYEQPSEKKTDVNIATELLLDAVDDRFDVAIVVSGDGDLLAPIEAVESRFSPKQVWMAFPPNRPNRETEAAASGKRRIHQALLTRCQLPETITLPSGVVIHRPERWAPEPEAPD